MNSSFRVSLLYLLLIIPQHGNSPLPLMESWLQKDQDDGVIEREMTSSLTGGDESFGTAHQTYQNSLIRKKKADTSGNLLPSIGYRKFALKSNRNQVQANPFFDGRYVNQDFSQSAVDTTRSNGMFENFNNNAGMPFHNKLQPRASSLIRDEFSNEGESNKNYEEDSNIMNSQFNLRANPVNEDYEKNDWPVWSGMKASYSPADQALENGYSGIDNEYRGRNQELRDSDRPEGQNPQVFQENEYYDSRSNSLNGEDDDYNQMLNNHAYPHKREDTKTSEPSKAAKVVLDALRYSDRNRGFNEDPSLLESMQETPAAHASSQNMENVNLKLVPDAKLVWKLNSDLQSQALSNVMRNSQRALQEVQQFQQKLYNKQPDGSETEGCKRENRNSPDGKYERRSIKFDEKRLKREDEDEQKNMKTGTDEGGGGEYEDEEGKGHKDEEEYYEDADLSDDDSANEVRTTDEQSEKYVKREVAEDDNSKNSKTEQIEHNSQDYELNLENAPVENSGKSRKALYREDNSSY